MCSSTRGFAWGGVGSRAAAQAVAGSNFQRGPVRGPLRADRSGRQGSPSHHRGRGGGGKPGSSTQTNLRMQITQATEDLLHIGLDHRLLKGSKLFQKALDVAPCAGTVRIRDNVLRERDIQISFQLQKLGIYVRDS